MKRFILAIFSISIILALNSCATTTKALYKLDIGDTKSEVISKIGEPTAVRGSIVNNYDQVIDVWEYRLYMYTAAIEGLSPYYNLYWLYFSNGELAQWGQAGDWQNEADIIIEHRFK